MNARSILAILSGVILASGPAPAQVRGGSRDSVNAGSASIRASGSSLGKIRLGAADPLWFSWKIGIPATAFPDLTFVEAASRADALSLGHIEGFDTQQAGPDVPKKLDYNLKPGERAAVTNRLRELNVRMPAYHVERIGSDENSRRKLFEFAKGMGVETIVSSPDPAALGDIDKLAQEFGIRIALRAASPKSALSMLEGRSKQIGVYADLGAWIDEGTQPLEALSLLKDRVIVVRLPDGGMTSAADFFLEAYRLELKPLFIAVDDVRASSIDALERALQPAMTARVRQVIDSPHGMIRRPDTLPAEMKEKIEAAVPRQALVKPKKPRRLLVIDLNMWSGHDTIRHGNLLLELMAKYTGAFELVFSNDLNNLKWDKIRQFDAVFLNNVVGMVFPDPEVREGLIRYVRDGGGLGGIHGTTYAALDWPEFTEMLGGWAGDHRVEKKMLKLDDPKSPLNAKFGGESFEHTDEFYHFPAGSPYSRDKLHVLLSIDVEKSDMATTGRFCTKCTRPDHDYGMSWIRNYGKGRVFCTPLGHTPILFTTAAWTHHILGGIQFILGDLDADATPSAKLVGSKRK